MKKTFAWLLTLALLLSCSPVAPLQTNAEATASAATVVDIPVAGTAYKFGMVQQNLDHQLYYITGVKGGYNNIYMATTLTAADAADVYLEETPGGYYLYTMVDSAKKYINMVVNGTYVNGEYEDAASTVYTYDSDSKTVVATVNNTPYCFGTRNDRNYDTVGPVKATYNGFHCQFYTVSEAETPDTPIEPDEPETPAEDGTELTIAEALELGASMAHNAYTDAKYKVTGVISQVYNTTHGNMKLTDEEGNILTVYGTFDATGEIRYDAMEVKPVAGDTVTIYGIIGQFNGTPQIKSGWIVAHTPSDTPPEAPEVPELPTEDGAVVSIAEALAYGNAVAHAVYSELKYKVTGQITEVYNTTYGNMKLADKEGNILTVYGTFDATGEIRYDAMEVQPIAGDTVTIYGVIGNYNGTPQIKNGWILEHIPASSEFSYEYVIKDGNAKITGYNGTVSGELTIPATLDGYPVTIIGDQAFVECDGLTSVIIPEGVTGIYWRAFAFCSNLTSVTLPDSLLSIGSDTFQNCTALTSIDLPENLTSIGTYTFQDCSSLTSVVIPEGVTTISEGAFWCCYNLKVVTLPATVTEIDFRAFTNCDITDLYYDGTVLQWQQVTGDGKAAFGSARIHCRGDLDDNTVTNENDAICLLQHVLLPEQYPIEQDVDYDKNGTVNEYDVIYLLQYILMPDTFPL